MTETAPLVLDVGLVLLLAAFLGWVARRIGLPAATGYLAAGLAVSPFTPGYVADREQISLLADIGVVILLFEVGIEVDVRNLGKTLRSLFWVVPAQVLLTTAFSAAALSLVGVSTPGALLVGLGIAFSSSVVIVNITRSQRRTTNKETEQALLGWSVVQDVSGVSFAAVLIALTGAGSTQPVIAILGLVLFCGVVITAAQIVPRVLRALQWERDLFLIVSVAVGLAIASVGAVFFGVPMALAAFVAGLAISDNQEMADARTALLPFRDVFAVLFFVAVGSLINPFEIGAALPIAALMVGLVVFAKVLPAYVLARVSKTPARAGQLAIGLGQVGEFSFVLAAVGQAKGLISGEVFTGILCAVLLTIPLSSVLARTAGVRRRA
jgi:CPA2 family monovalent cation:H+ antiporter-2